MVEGPIASGPSEHGGASASWGAPAEGSTQAPVRHDLAWREPAFYDAEACNAELARVYDICHGCRRCVSLCDAFPTLFDLVDESPTFEVDGVDVGDYGKVAEQCYLCDLCFQTKCPYVPPHEWAVDFPHLMLRAKAIAFKQRGTGLRDRVLSSTDRLGSVISAVPGIGAAVDAANRAKPLRRALQGVLGVHADAPLPRFGHKTLRRRWRAGAPDAPPEAEATAAGPTRGRVALFASCYGNYNAPDIGADLAAVLMRNGIETRLLPSERCCGMPKLELGDLEAVDALRQHNLPVMREAVDAGWDIVAPVPSCVLMFKQELALMYPQDEDVQRVRERVFDPFEYLAHRHRAGLLDTEFAGEPIGRLDYQLPCHQRVQNIGRKTCEVLSLVPGTELNVIERCSGHDGSYAVKRETRESSVKIARRALGQMDAEASEARVASDCPMAATHLAGLRGKGAVAVNPISLLRRAYGDIPGPEGQPA